MNYEVMHGPHTYYLEASTPYQACLNALKNEAQQDSMTTGPFQVTRLHDGVSEEIPMATIVRLLILANGDDVPSDTSPKIDLSCW